MPEGVGFAKEMGNFWRLLGLLALQILIIGHHTVDELSVSGEVKDAVTHGLDELMVVGGHQNVAFDHLQALVQGGDGLQVQVVGGLVQIGRAHV